jgi:N-acetylmuramoyl-L-alanine amidase
MKAARLVSFLFSLLILPLSVAAEVVSVENMRQWRAPDHTRLVFDLSAPLEHRLFTLRDPHRVVIDMDNARLTGSLSEFDASGPLVAAVRSGRTDSRTLRIVLDLKIEARPRTFVLKPAGQYGHRLVIDLYDTKPKEGGHKPSAPPPGKTIKRDLVIAIDAGHGGEDPGAIGRRYRTLEKNVTLAIARELTRLVNRASGMQAFLIRDGDYSVSLRHRYMKANRQDAHMFISIHADALPGRRKAFGASVYALSEKGASNKMAQILADKENAADEIGGVVLEDMDDDVAMTIVDLRQSKAIEHSILLGQDILAGLGRIGPVHFRQVRQAGFTVLKSTKYPSVLVETAFISNPSEEKKLRTQKYQHRLAQGIFDGLKRFVARNILDLSHPPVKMASSTKRREHLVLPGETLGSIAQKYDVHIEALRFANNLRGQELTVGSRLSIP